MQTRQFLLFDWSRVAVMHTVYLIQQRGVHYWQTLAAGCAIRHLLKVCLGVVPLWEVCTWLYTFCFRKTLSNHLVLGKTLRRSCQSSRHSDCTGTADWCSVHCHTQTPSNCSVLCLKKKRMTTQSFQEKVFLKNFQQAPHPSSVHGVFLSTFSPISLFSDGTRVSGSNVHLHQPSLESVAKMIDSSIIFLFFELASTLTTAMLIGAIGAVRTTVAQKTMRNTVDALRRVVTTESRGRTWTARRKSGLRWRGKKNATI